MERQTAYDFPVNIYVVYVRNSIQMVQQLTMSVTAYYQREHRALYSMPSEKSCKETDSTSLPCIHKLIDITHMHTHARSCTRIHMQTHTIIHNLCMHRDIVDAHVTLHAHTCMYELADASCYKLHTFSSRLSCSSLCQTFQPSGTVPSCPQSEQRPDSRPAGPGG